MGGYVRPSYVLSTDRVILTEGGLCLGVVSADRVAHRLMIHLSNYRMLIH